MTSFPFTDLPTECSVNNLTIQEFVLGKPFPSFGPFNGTLKSFNVAFNDNFFNLKILSKFIDANSMCFSNSAL